ncbi:MAG TPA: DMT family transporter [Mycobacteriales bacterium]|nr:DMT family transporter [Mycobacteriales bacterium]
MQEGTPGRSPGSPRAGGSGSGSGGARVPGRAGGTGGGPDLPGGRPGPGGPGVSDGRPGPRPGPGVPGGPRGADAIALPPPRDTALIAVALAAVSTSGPIIAATAAPALAIAFWRNAMASGALVPIALLRRRGELRRLDRRQWGLCVLAGTLLAGHFATWVPSVTLTSVASSTALVATQPVWAALLARASGRQVRPSVWAGIMVSVLGAVLLTGADLSLSGRALVGDLLATVGGALAAGYVTAGAAVQSPKSSRERLIRPGMTTTAYTAVCYSTCALLLLALCLASGQRLAGYDGDTWAKLVGLTLGAQLLGHSLLNVVLRTTSPTVVSLAILFEVPGAGTIAAVWLGQVPPLTALPGLLLLLAGIALVIRAGARAVPVE